MEKSRIYFSNSHTAHLIAACAIALLLATGFTAVGQVQAADAPRAAVPAEPADPSRVWFQRLDNVEQRLRNTEALSDIDRASLEHILNEVHSEAKGALARDEKIIQPLRKELGSLGIAPAAETPTETPEVVALRKRLEGRIARIDGQIQTARLVIVRAENLYTTLGGRQAGKIQHLWERSPELLKEETWRKAGAAFSSLGTRVVAAPGAWWASVKGSWRPAWITVVFLAALLAVVFAVPARRWLRRRFIIRATTVEEPDEAQRTIHAAKIALAEVVLPLAGLGILAAAVSGFSSRDGFFEAMLVDACLSGMIFFAIAGLARAALAPNDPRWRVLPVTETGAHRLDRRIRVIAIYVALAVLLRSTAEFGEPPAPEFTAVRSLFTTTGFAVLLLLLLPGHFWETSDAAAWRVGSVLVRGIIAIGLVAVPIVDIAGYSAFSTFVLVRLLVTVGSVGATLLLRAVVHEWLAKMLRALLEGALRLPEESARLVRFWFSLFTDIIIFGLLVYELLVFYGLSREFLNLWLWQALTGIRFGDITISLTDIILAILVFVTGLAVTGWIKRWVSKTMLSRTQMDIGVRESIASGIGYIGIVIAIVLAVLAVGIDLSKLALIAGALSVGVGFGLKTVVENFAAGLLLLIERPIKAGDWIIVSGHQGIVRKISVRSTEIETFDRASVIVPNADLISQPVENWTHKSKTARLAVPVGVAYGSNTEKVREALLACAAANDEVLNYPRPNVLFRAFGDSSLNFELRCFIPDAHRRRFVTSDLHFAVDAAFREAGIEIAFPQRDLHIRDANFDKPVEETGESIEDTGEGADVSTPQA